MATRKWKKELIEWGLIIAVFLVLYLTGSHVWLIGNLQRLVLKTGIFNPGDKKEMVEVNAPTLELMPLHGKEPVTIDFSGEKPVVINLWATWCPPCIAELPSLQELYDDKKDEVDFLLISLDKDKQMAKDFIRKKGYDFPVYFAPFGLPSQFETETIPTGFIVREGKIIWKHKGIANYSSGSFRKLVQ